MHTSPKLDDRAAVPYLGIRVQVPMSEFSSAIPQNHDIVFEWLGQRGIEPAGAPFIRYHVINMEGLMDIELGVPVAEKIDGDDRVKSGEIPAGKYASLVYTGIDNGIPANGVLIDWANQQALVWDRWDDPNGDAFAGRVEFFLTNPDDEPDMAKWETEVAIKLAD